MKKIAVLIAGLTVGFSLFAQENASNDGEYFYQNMPLEKIYQYRDGYILIYRSGINSLAKAYIPMEWFDVGNKKAELIWLPQGRSSWPYLMVFYKGGEFSHVRLYAHTNLNSGTWGRVPQNVNLDRYFEGIEKIQLKY